MKFGVIVFPGSNCEADIMYALGHDLKQEVIKLWHKDSDLSMFSTEDCIVLPGGFSYGDYLRCGAIAKFSPMMQSVIDFANRGGKVLGICNGFQILCECGLLPGALLRNAEMQFLCFNIYMTDDKTVAKQPYKVPIAHGEGRYYADQKTLEDLNNNNQILYWYCDKDGVVNDAANHNGSTQNIAGICNEGRNVIGMMPHPERACSSILGNEDGKKILHQLFFQQVPA
jgi:phosphoribosylformylglycinamidine synthase subunit PurQ / glutaminase